MLQHQQLGGGATRVDFWFTVTGNWLHKLTTAACSALLPDLLDWTTFRGGHQNMCATSFCRRTETRLWRYHDHPFLECVLVYNIIYTEHTHINIYICRAFLYKNRCRYKVIGAGTNYPEITYSLIIYVNFFYFTWEKTHCKSGCQTAPWFTMCALSSPKHDLLDTVDIDILCRFYRSRINR